MKTLKLKNGAEVPTLGLGTWFLGDSAATREREIEALRIGIEAGATLIDTAEMYGSGRSEDLVSEAILPFRREDLYLVSKVLPSNADSSSLPRALDASLERLGTDYLDLYLYHWRGGVPLEETVEALEDARVAGKIAAWGVSNFDDDDVAELLDIPAAQACLTNQVLYNLGAREAEWAVIPACVQEDMAIMAYAPTGQKESRLTTNPVVEEIATEIGATPMQILIAWTLAQPRVISIPRTGNPDHMRENVAAAEISLNAEQLGRLNLEFPPPSRPVTLGVI